MTQLTTSPYNLWKYVSSKPAGADEASGELTSNYMATKAIPSTGPAPLFSTGGEQLGDPPWGVEIAAHILNS